MHYPGLLYITVAVVVLSSPLPAPSPQVVSLEVTDADRLAVSHESPQIAGVRLEIGDHPYSTSISDRPIQGSIKTDVQEAKEQPGRTQTPSDPPQVPVSNAPSSKGAKDTVNNSAGSVSVSRQQPTTKSTPASVGPASTASRNTAGSSVTPLTPPPTGLATAYKMEKDREAKVYQDWKVATSKYFLPPTTSATKA